MAKIYNSRQWINDPTRTKKVTSKNIEYIRELRILTAEMGKLGTLEYFLVTQLGIGNVAKMMNSVGKQKALAYCLEQNLKVYGMRKDAEVAIGRDIEAMKRRVEYVWNITKDNIRLTKYYCFFEENGFDVLKDFETKYLEGYGETPLNHLTEQIEQWNAEHEEEIAKHLESIRDEVETRKAHKADMIARDKAEKQAEKDRAKAERAEEKELEKIRKAVKTRERKIERSFERYYSKKIF